MKHHSFALLAVMAALSMAGCNDQPSTSSFGSDAGSGSDAAQVFYDSSGPWGPSADGGAGFVPPDDPQSGDEFEDVGTNPFVEVGHDPFSTFAADVDTASYDIFVRDIEDGILPDPLSVRLEEYINAFDYDYEIPEFGAEVPFTIDLSASAHPMGRELAQLRVGIQAADPPGFEKLPTNLVFLVDTSGSMRAADKLPLVQFLLRQAVSALDENDTVSIVSYAGDVAVRLGPTEALDCATFIRAIDGLTAAGGTAGASGINLAYDQAAAGFIDDGFNHVVLCTDGDFNIGISDSDALVALIEEKRRTGITLTAIGFGRGNLNDAMMERVSNAGNGIYSVMSSEPQARDYAANTLLRTAHHVAQDMKLQVEFNPEHVLAYRLLGYENRAIADMEFRDDTVDAGEVGAGMRVTALYELVLVGQEIPAPLGAPEVESGEPVEGAREIAAEELVQVRVRWKELGATEEDPAQEVSAGLTHADLGSGLSDGDANLLWASAIAAFAEILKGSPFANSDDLAPIREITSAQSARDADRAAFVEHFTAAERLLPR